MNWGKSGRVFMEDTAFGLASKGKQDEHLGQMSSELTSGDRGVREVDRQTRMPLEVSSR